MAFGVSPAPETVGDSSGEGFLALLGFSNGFTSPPPRQDWETARCNKASHQERSWPGRPAGLSLGPLTWVASFLIWSKKKTMAEAQVLGSSCRVVFPVITRGDRPVTMSGGVAPNRGHGDEPQARGTTLLRALLWTQVPPSASPTCPRCSGGDTQSPRCTQARHSRQFDFLRTKTGIYFKYANSEDEKATLGQS